MDRRHATSDGTYQHLDAYNELPECVKACISPKQYAWMGYEQRATLIEDLTTPEPEND